MVPVVFIPRVFDMRLIPYAWISNADMRIIGKKCMAVFTSGRCKHPGVTPGKGRKNLLCCIFYLLERQGKIVKVVFLFESIGGKVALAFFRQAFKRDLLTTGYPLRFHDSFPVVQGKIRKHNSQLFRTQARC